ncbi:uncharacterized protein LOC133711510 [Rosa rugosa]|uniref:uncharacterized protein LOC133711510 n=1 Tax=Rosa rugosa TaxID=74645 RepID=UPI002B40477F|nr:uncharacterized protein LOC133711510 [Rosa rugosa]
MEVQESQDRKPSSDSIYRLFMPTMCTCNTALNLLFNCLTTCDEAEVEARLLEKDAFAATSMIIGTIYSEEISERIVEVLKAKNTGSSAAGNRALLLPDVGRLKPILDHIIKDLSSPFSPFRDFGTFPTDEAKALAPLIEQEAFVAAMIKIRQIYIHEVCKRMVEIKHKNAAASAAGNVASETAAGGVPEAIESQVKSMELAESTVFLHGHKKKDREATTNISLSHLNPPTFSHRNSSSTMEVQDSQDRKPSSDSIIHSLFLPTMVFRNTAVDLLFNFLTTYDEAEVEAEVKARLFEEDAFAVSRSFIGAIYSDEISNRVLEFLKAKNTDTSAAGKGAMLLPDVGVRKPFVGIIIKNLSSPSSPWRHYGTFSTDEAKALAPFIEREAFFAARDKIRKIYIQEVCQRMFEIKHKNAAASAAGNVASETAAGGVPEAIESQLKSMDY